MNVVGAAIQTVAEIVPAANRARNGEKPRDARNFPIGIFFVKNPALGFVGERRDKLVLTQFFVGIRLLKVGYIKLMQVYHPTIRMDWT